MMWHNSKMVQTERLPSGTWVSVGRWKLRNHATGRRKKQWNEELAQVQEWLTLKSTDSQYKKNKSFSNPTKND